MSKKSMPEYKEATKLKQFFAYAHLPPHLQEVSKPFGELAEKMMEILPANIELVAAIRKLLEGKDAAVRALVFKEPSEPIPVLLCDGAVVDIKA